MVFAIDESLIELGNERHLAARSDHAYAIVEKWSVGGGMSTVSILMRAGTGGVKGAVSPATS